MLELLQRAGDRAIFNLPMRDREEAYEDAARLYPGYQVEMDHAGNIKIMLPIGAEGGGQEAEALIQVGIWNKQTLLGKVFSSQTVFRLPSGAKLMADAGWMPMAEWRQIDDETRRSYRGVLVPAFIIEVRSQSDNLAEVEAKCREWIAGGVREAWLIDPLDRKTHIFRPNANVVTDTSPLVAGPSFMPGLILNLKLIWES